MWVKILCALIVYKLFRLSFADDDDDLEVENSDTNAVFNVASRLEKLYGGKAYVGLRIPDAETGSRQNIDIVLVTKGEAVVVSVKNVSGIVSVSGDGSWVCEGYSRHKAELIPDPVEETKRQALVLESYLEQRGVSVPEGYLSQKVVRPYPMFNTIHSFPPEVITYDQYVQLKPEPKEILSGRITSLGGKTIEMEEPIYQNLNFVLSTAPTWDRLELKRNKYVLGEFFEFKGQPEDMRSIKRSKVGRLMIQKEKGIFGSDRLKVLYFPRDYRNEGTSQSDRKELTVSPNTEVRFRRKNSTKVGKIKLASIVSMSLSG